LFLKPQTLDYMIEHRDLLIENNLTVGPVLTSGIPSVEYFCEDFLEDDARKKIQSLFLNTHFYTRDGVNYIELNKHTGMSSATISSEWNKTEFFDNVKKINHYYKGIHPIRVNNEALHYLNDYIIKNKERFMKEYELNIILDKPPYLCNSIFCIKTDIYKKIVEDNTLYVDAFDEVPLNKYAWKHNMNHLFVKNGFAIHMYYNWLHNHTQYEKDFCNKFFNETYS